MSRHAVPGHKFTHDSENLNVHVQKNVRISLTGFVYYNDNSEIVSFNDLTSPLIDNSQHLIPLSLDKVFKRPRKPDFQDKALRKLKSSQSANVTVYQL